MRSAGRFPLYGLFGAAVVVAAELLLVAGSPLVGRWFTPIVWTGYVVFMDAVVRYIDGTGDDLSPRNGSMPSIDRSSERGIDSAPIASSLTAPKLMEPSLGDLGSLGDSMFTSDSWLDGPGGSLADHPLLRGLLLELPPKGSMPHQDWLDRWFEAARSILELLYAHESPGR